MPIFIRVVTELWCDICKVQDEFIHDTKTEAISLARQAGWKIGKHCTCPKCSTESISAWSLAAAVKRGSEIIELPPIRTGR